MLKEGTLFLVTACHDLCSHQGKDSLSLVGSLRIRTSEANHSTDHGRHLNRQMTAFFLPQILIGASNSSKIG